MEERLITGSRRYVSTRLRLEAIVIVRLGGRPMAISEICYLTERTNPPLWKEVCQKCPDYVRIIIGKTAAGVFKQYWPTREMRNVDTRSIFYGFESTKYDSNLWTDTEERGFHAMNAARRAQALARPPPVPPPPPPPPPQPEQVGMYPHEQHVDWLDLHKEGDDSSDDGMAWLASNNGF